jgi:multisubunit Na+/H+ antiporter MnhE subunit
LTSIDCRHRLTYVDADLACRCGGLRLGGIVRVVGWVPVRCRGKRWVTWFFVYLAWRLWKSVLRLAVRGNSISGRVVRRQRVPVFDKHRLPSTGSRWDIRWVSGGGKTRFFVYLAWRLWKSVLRLAVRGNSISGRVVRRQRVPVFEGHRLPSTGSRWDIRWVSGGGKTRFFVYLAWRLWKSVLRLAVRGNSISGRVVRRQRVPVFDRGIDCRRPEVDGTYGG